jgi:hypothetical protein
VKLITYDVLSRLLRGAAEHLDREVDIIIVGGSAVLAWCPHGTATRDIDAMRTEGTGAFIKAVHEWCLAHDEEPVDVNTSADPFEVFFPDDWRDNVRTSDALSTGPLRVHLPRPEDLAVAKVFRFVAKDAEDIARLSALASFDRKVMMTGFLNVLPFAIGNPREHALSFAMAWNRLYPDEPVELENLLTRARLIGTSHTSD